jgi:hypothetical protein
MTSIWLWLAALVAGTAAVSYGATTGQGMHMAIAALVCAGFVLLALLDRNRRVKNGDSEPALAGATAASIALVWAWAGLSMLVTYQLFLSWHEWWQYVLAGIGVAALSLGLASMMAKDDAAGRRDETLLRVARYLTIAQFAGMIIAMIGMVIDGKMPRDPSEPDWAANAIFFFGAAALAIISANALWGPSARRADA